MIVFVELNLAFRLSGGGKAGKKSEVDSVLLFDAESLEGDTSWPAREQASQALRQCDLDTQRNQYATE